MMMTMPARRVHRSKMASAMAARKATVANRRSRISKSSIVAMRLSTSSAELDPSGRCSACVWRIEGTTRWTARTVTR